MHSNLLELFFALLIGHAVCDYPLQGDFLARGKNRFSPLPGIPWYWCMGAHAAIHAGAVWALTGAWWLGALELIAHWWIDDWKCKANTTAVNPETLKLLFDRDQLNHITCKAMWVALLWVVARW